MTAEKREDLILLANNLISDVKIVGLTVIDEKTKYMRIGRTEGQKQALEVVDHYF